MREFSGNFGSIKKFLGNFEDFLFQIGSTREFLKYEGALWELRGSLILTVEPEPVAFLLLTL